jgi:NTP pyrophosphatase (non-canonical NTP hydrolase)
MTPHEYQLVTEQTGLYPEGGTGSLIAINYCALGLGEAGETQGKLKKVWRGDKPLHQAKEEIVDELGDILWYVVRMAAECNVSFQELIDRNAAKVLDRKARGVTRGSGDHR